MPHRDDETTCRKLTESAKCVGFQANTRRNLIVLLLLLMGGVNYPKKSEREKGEQHRIQIMTGRQLKVLIKEARALEVMQELPGT